MCPNRVEELESRVQELEASVEGLTDELVECKVRLRELENAVDDDLGFEAKESEEDTEEIAQPETSENNTEAADTEDNAEEQGSDIIIA